MLLSLITLATFGQLKPDTSQFDPIKNYNQTIVQPCHTRGGTISGYACVIPLPPVSFTPSTPKTVTEAPVASYGDSLTGSLIGSIGYSLAGGNCVLVGGINNPGWGNPFDWPVLTRTPSIGATVLFTWNHTARVTGIWSNGDVEVAQENAGGMPHRIPAGEVRGYR